MRRLTNIVVAASLMALPVVSIAAAQPRCGGGSHPWKILHGPRFTGDQTIHDIAIERSPSGRVFATNGTEVMVSSDRGCSWERSFSPERAPGSVPSLDGSAVVEEIEASGALTYLLIEQDSAMGTRPRVFTTADGTTWRAADSGLPPSGGGALLRVAPGDPRSAYLTVDLRGTDALFASSDGGATWQPRGRIPDSEALDLAVGPLDRRQLWLGTDDGLYVSADGGISFSPVNEFTGRATGPLDVYQHEGPARIVAFHPDDGFGQMSEDGGRTWARIDQPGAPGSIASGRAPLSIALAAGNKVYAYSPAIFGWVDLDAPLEGVANLEAAGAGASIYGHTARKLAIYDGPLDVSLEVPQEIVEIPDVSLIEGTAPHIRQRARLAPASTTVRLEPGETDTVKYRLSLPATVTPVDLVFVVDTSSSMTQFIDEAVKALAAIHTGLVRSGAAVHFGLVDYRSYPTDVPPDAETDNYVYRRVLDVGASAVEMEDAISELLADGGGTYDAQLEALWQLATGDGRDVWPPGPSSRDVAPGQQVNFRKQALRVVVHVGDEPFGRENSTSDNDGIAGSAEDRAARPDIPEFGAVARELRRRAIRHVGLSLYEPATGDLRDMAEATGTFAPQGGADCDGDAQVDVPSREPLVCEVSPDQVTGANMTPAILGLVAALRSTTDVGLEVRGGDEVVQSITPPAHRDVVLAARRALAFEVTYRCPRVAAPRRAALELVATGLLGASPVAEARVVCRSAATSTVAAPPVARAFEQALALPPVLPMRPPPPPVSPPSGTQAHGQPQPSAGFAAQEQEQPQVAFAHQLDPEPALGREEEYEFVSLKRDEPVPALPLAGATVLMSIAYGVATRLGDRPQVEHDRVRRRRRGL